MTPEQLALAELLFLAGVISPLLFLVVTGSALAPYRQRLLRLFDHPGCKAVCGAARWIGSMGTLVAMVFQSPLSIFFLIFSMVFSLPLMFRWIFTPYCPAT